jgi:2,3-diketo-5-methylthio-1-phosphopentane phosphatase
MRQLPAADVFCDFDGTITTVDATDVLLEHFALPAWKEWEARWTSGEVGSRDCMTRQVELVRASRATLVRFAESLPVDAGIVELSRRCSERGARLWVVSDGLDLVARAVLGRLGLAHIPVFANRLVPRGVETWTLASPYASPRCESGAGTCKCEVAGLLERPQGPGILIGDGRSDRCAAEKMSTVYAKGSLRNWCASRNIPHRPFDTLSDVAQSIFSSEASAR